MPFRTRYLSLGVLSLLATNVFAAEAPPMGWNPWNAFRTEVTEAKIMAVADTLVKTGLADAGYRYVNIDDGWWLKRRDDGRIVVRTTMIPSAAPAKAGAETSLRPFVDRLHSMGLKAGIYTDIGRNACSQAWDRKSPNLPEGSVAEREIGSMDHQAQDMRLIFGEWRFDYLKVDACGVADFAPERAFVQDGTFRAQEPYIVREHPVPATDAKIEALYASLAQAIVVVRPKSDYVLSICTWGEASVAEWGNKYGTTWRTSPDISARWDSMLGNFDSAAVLADKAGPGHWNDPDMLEVGNGEFDENHLTEARAHMSLWAMISAPLLLGSDVTKWPQSLIDIAGNREVIAIDQSGPQATIVSRTAETEILMKPLGNGSTAVALVNRGNAAVEASVALSQIGLTWPMKATVRDVWTRQEQTLTTDRITAALKPHETALFVVKDR